MKNTSTLSEKEIRRRAFAEAAALLACDADSADLQCDSDGNVTELDAEKVREYIRNQIVDLLEERSSR